MICGFCGGTKMVRYYGYKLDEDGFSVQYSFVKPCPRCQSAQQGVQRTAARKRKTKMKSKAVKVK
jgi:hypothetical protein